MRSCAELYLAEMHNRCNSPHRSGPQRCQVAGRQRAGSMMCCPSVFHASLNGEGPFRWLHLRQPRSKFTVSKRAACVYPIMHSSSPTFMRMAVQVRTRRRFPARQRVAGKSHQCSDDNPCLSHKSSRICIGWARHVPSAVAAPPPSSPPVPLFGIRLVSLRDNLCVY